LKVRPPCNVVRKQSERRAHGTPAGSSWLP
jgi:hypothetical protein